MSGRAGISGNGGSFSSLCAGQIYGPDSTCEKSSNILVAEGETIWVHATGLIEGDHITVYQVLNGECVPYMPLPCLELCMDFQGTSIALGVPGTYALEINPDALGRVTVVTNIDCDSEGYLNWLKCYEEAGMAKKINAQDVTYNNPDCPFMVGVNDVDGALDVLAAQVKEGSDDQTAAEVPFDSAGCEDTPVEGTATVQEAIKALAAEVDDNTTYAFTDALPNADGSACIITVTSSGDDDPQEITVPKPPAETGTYIDGTTPPVIDLVAGTITYPTVNDVDESAGPPLVQDISALMAFLTSPNYVAGTNITFTTLANGDVEISATDTDTTIVGTLTTNPDGSYTYDAGDGSDPVIIAAPTQYVDWDGNPITAATPIVTGNAIDRVRVVQGCREYRYCDGTLQLIQTEEVRRFLSLAIDPTPIDSATAEGTVMGISTAVPIHNKCCESRGGLFIEHSYVKTAGFSGNVVVRPQYSINGGAWVDIATTGLDSVSGDVDSNTGEIQFTEFVGLPVTQPGDTVQIRTIVLTNNITSGEIIPQAANGIVSRLQDVEC